MINTLSEFYFLELAFKAGYTPEEAQKLLQDVEKDNKLRRARNDKNLPTA